VKVVIFGATGKSGVLVTKRALEEGLHVTAYVRASSKLQLQHERLTVYEGGTDRYRKD
jgi:putative NADH-flavin reductase